MLVLKKSATTRHGHWKTQPNGKRVWVSEHSLQYREGVPGDKSLDVKPRQIKTNRKRQEQGGSTGGSGIVSSNGPLTFFHASPASLSDDPKKLNLKNPDEGGWLIGNIPDESMLSGSLTGERADHWAKEIEFQKDKKASIYKYKLPVPVSNAIRRWITLFHEAWNIGVRDKSSEKAEAYMADHGAGKLRARYGFNINIDTPREYRQGEEVKSPDDWIILEVTFSQNPWLPKEGTR